jgi:N-acetylneuraminate lyase
MAQRLTGLVAAAFTPMKPDGSLNLDRVGPVSAQLIREGVNGLFVCGSTGESASMSSEEREAVAQAYVDAVAGRVPVVVHVGHCSLVDARRLAVHAQKIGAAAVSACAPFYFKPASVEVLVDCMAQIALAVPEMPFYYYNIPSMTGVLLDMLEVTRQASQRMPNFVGIKYTAPTVDEFQALLNYEGGRFNILYGRDEMLLSGLAIGAKGAIGSTYNFAAPLYRRLIDAFERRDLAEAAAWQARAVEMIRIVLGYRGLVGMKALMGLIGVDCGPTRLPLVPLSAAQTAQLRKDLEGAGFFQWGRPSPA